MRVRIRPRLTYIDCPRKTLSSEAVAIFYEIVYRPIVYITLELWRPSRQIHLNVHIEFDAEMVGKGVRRLHDAITQMVAG